MRMRKSTHFCGWVCPADDVVVPGADPPYVTGVASSETNSVSVRECGDRTVSAVPSSMRGEFGSHLRQSSHLARPERTEAGRMGWQL